MLAFFRLEGRVSRSFTFVKKPDTSFGYKQGQKAVNLTTNASALNFKFVKKSNNMMLSPCMKDRGRYSFFILINFQYRKRVFLESCVGNGWSLSLGNFVDLQAKFRIVFPSAEKITICRLYMEIHVLSEEVTLTLCR